MPHFLNLNAMPLPVVQQLLTRALAFKDGEKPVDKATFVTNIFLENSTRTQSSFQVAEAKMGMQQVSFDPKTSSLSKGETLADTLKLFKAIGTEVAVVRHFEERWWDALLADQGRAPMPNLINAGDGSGQHPSQSLLDLVTIQENFASFANLNIRIVGDLAHSRVARSNAEILTKLGAHVTFAGPIAWYPSDFDEFGAHVALDDAWEQQDVVMFLRVQHERLGEAQSAEFDVAQYHAAYGLNDERYAALKKSAIIMHPAPVNRGVEIADHLVEAPQSRIFEQMANGVFARMAILEYVLGA